jgi:alkylated DNA nucleotide flippase Atl1
VTHDEIRDYIAKEPGLLTYGGVARDLGIHPRLVGRALSDCPDDYPHAHRVLNKGYVINPRWRGPTNTGPAEAAARLAADGYTVIPKGDTFVVVP